MLDTVIGVLSRLNSDIRAATRCKLLAFKDVG